MPLTVRSILVSIGVEMLEFFAGLVIGLVVGAWMILREEDAEIYKPMKDDDEDDWNYR